MGERSLSDIKLFTGNANPELAKEIAVQLGLELGNSEITRFSDQEVQVKIEESVRGKDVYIIQPTSQPVNEHLMELLIIIDALKRASARSIVAVVPYYGYARQDRKSKARDPITAKLVADLLTTAGANRLIGMDLHAGQIQGFFNIPVDHLMAAPILAEYFINKGMTAENTVVVSPDLGGVTRARQLANRLNTSLAIIDKRRPAPNIAEIMNIIGNIDGKNVIMIDDIIDTAGTITLGAKALKDYGAKDVYACCTHPILSGPAIERLRDSCLKEIVVTNTIALSKEKQLDKIKVLSVAPMLAEVIQRIHDDLSISVIFK